MRALVAQDVVAARALVRSVNGDLSHLTRTLELLELALPSDDPEYQGLVSPCEGGSVGAMVVYGSVGGASGVVKLHTLIGSTVDALAAVIDALRRAHASRDARMFICELSGEQEDALAYRALTSANFACEARVADYFADGVALHLLVLRHAE